MIQSRIKNNWSPLSNNYGFNKLQKLKKTDIERKIDHESELMCGVRLSPYDCFICTAFKCNFQSVINFRRMNTVRAILITMGQIRYQNLQKKQTYNVMHSCIRLLVWNLWGHLGMLCYFLFILYYKKVKVGPVPRAKLG